MIELDLMRPGIKPNLSETTENRNRAAPSVGIIHDWLPLIGGAEKVVKELSHALDASDIYTVFNFLSKSEQKDLFGDVPIHTSKLNRLPFAKSYYRHLILLATRAVEAFDVSKHDVVLSSSAAISKGVITSSEQLHISYVHSPARYAWDMTHEYLETLNGPLSPLKKMIAHEMMHRFRIWDMRTIQSADYLIANSKFIQQRIWKTYRREASVIYPPVDIDGFNIGSEVQEDYYFTVSRMVSYKKMDLIVEAFAQRPNLRLVMAGDGPDFEKLKRISTKNVRMIGRIAQDELVSHLQKCRAFVFAAKEDFGILPVEAQACGKPVIALALGGTAETVRGLSNPAPTGVLFPRQTVDSLLLAIDQMEVVYSDIRQADCRHNAERYRRERFHNEIQSYVSERRQ